MYVHHVRIVCIKMGSVFVSYFKRSATKSSSVQIKSTITIDASIWSRVAQRVSGKQKEPLESATQTCDFSS